MVNEEMIKLAINEVRENGGCIRVWTTLSGFVDVAWQSGRVELTSN